MAFTEFDGELDEAPAAGFREFTGQMDAAPIQARRGGTRREAAPYVAGGTTEAGDPRQYGVEPSNVMGGRGVVVEKGDERAVFARGQQPLQDKRAAIDEAVDLVEMGAPPAQVFERFAKMGVSQQEIIARGQSLGGKAFTPDTRPVTVRTGALTGTMQPNEPTTAQGVANFGRRVAERGGQMATGALAAAGAIPVDSAAASLAASVKREQAAMPGADMQAGLADLTSAKTFGEVFSAIGRNPAAASMLFAESATMFLPVLALATVMAPGTAGTAAMFFSYSAAMEFGGALTDALGEKGIDARDVEAIGAALRDPDFMAEVRKKGVIRGLTVGAFDALSAGMAGRFIEPVISAARAGRLTAGQAARQAALAATKEIGLQAAAGGGGEAAAQAFTGDFKPLDIVLEAVGEVVTGPVEAYANLRAARPGPMSVEDALITALETGQTRKPAIRAEDMPTTPFTPEQVGAMAAQRNATRAAAAPIVAPSEEAIPVGEVAELPAARAPGAADVGASAIPQGSLAAMAAQQLKDRYVQPDVAMPAGETARAGDGRGNSPTRSVGTVGLVPDASGGVVLPAAAPAADAGSAAVVGDARGVDEALTAPTVAPQNIPAAQQNDTSKPLGFASTGEAVSTTGATKDIPEAPIAQTFKTSGAALVDAAQKGIAQEITVQEMPNKGGFIQVPKPRPLTAADQQADQTKVDALQASVNKAGWKRPDGKPYAIKVAKNPPPAVTILRRAIEVAFGIRLTPITGSGSNGLASGKNVFLDVSRVFDPESVLGVIAHEVKHWLDINMPDLGAGIDRAAEQYLRTDAVDRQLDVENNNLQRNEVPMKAPAAKVEVLANINGAMWFDWRFWGRVYDLDNGSTMRRVVYQFMQAASRLINVTQDGQFDANRYLVKEGIDAVREAAAQAWASRAKGQKAPQELVGDSLPAQSRKADPQVKPATDTREAERSAALRSSERGSVDVGGFKVKTGQSGMMMVFGDAAEIKARMPENVVGRNVNGGVMFTASDAPRAKAALDGRKLAYSRGGAVLKSLPLATNGTYLGAPPDFNTPQTIGKLRRILRKLTDEGAPGRFWYENSGVAVLRMVGGNRTEAKKFLALLAIYSPQAKVDANSTFALRAWAQYKAGHPISVKTGVMDAKAQAALDDVDAFWSGEKTGNFVTNLLRVVDPTLEQGATIDMWMMRAAQYPTDAPTKTQYAFMENEANRIAAELGWEPQQVQAAIWVAMKARMENKGVGRKTEAKSEKRGWLRYDYPVKKGVPTKTRVILNAPAHRENWLQHSMDHDVTKDDTAKAKFDFEDGVRRHIGQISWEARPGRSTGILPGIHDAPYDQQVEFQQAIQKALYSDDGVDLLAQKLGLLTEGDVLAPGVWQADIAAGMQKLVAMAPAKGDDGKSSLDPAQKKALDTYAAILGLLLKQEGVGWHRPFYQTTKRAANGVELRIGRVMTPAEAKELWSAIDSRMRAEGVNNWEEGAGIISSPVGMRVVNFGAMPDNNAFRALVKSTFAGLSHGEVESVDFASDGNLVGNDWKEGPNGEAYRSRVGEEGRPDLLRWAGDILAPRVQAVFEDFSKRYGWGDPGRAEQSSQAASEASAEEVASAAPAPSQSRAGYANRDDPFAAGYSRLEGRKLAMEVRIEDTGQTATLRTDSAQYLRELDGRLDTARRLAGCIAR